MKKRGKTALIYLNLGSGYYILITDHKV